MRRRKRDLSALANPPLLIAHRGGSLLAPENTLAAFRRAVDLWACDMIELDVHASADGQCVVIHDATVDRTTNGTGAVREMNLDELQSLDAGYRFTADNGRTFPFRETGVTISTIDEVLEALPRTRFTVELKTAEAQVPLRAAIERFQATRRVVVAGMYASDRALFRDYTGAISASREQLTTFWLLHRAHVAAIGPLDADVVQAPEWHGSHRLITPRFIRDLHRRRIQLHVWTVNDEAEMIRFLTWGVDGIVTDRPDLLDRVLQTWSGRPPAPGHKVGV